VSRFTERSCDGGAKSFEELQNEYDSLVKLAKDYWIAASKQDPQSDRHNFFVHCAKRVENKAKRLCVSVERLSEQVS